LIFPLFFRRLICRVVGHEMEMCYIAGRIELLECLRCGRKAWRVIRHEG